MSFTLQSVCVYCGSRPGADPGFAAAAQSMGGEIARRGLTLIYGGGSLGLMNVTADAALAAGGRVVGVITDLLMEREVGHQKLSELHVVQNMHQRKQGMADRADGFVALPGGIGTLEELFEAWTWSQLGYHHKPIGLLNVNGYFDPLLDFLAHMERQGFVTPAVLSLVCVAAEPAALLDTMQRWAERPDDTWWTMRGQI